MNVIPDSGESVEEVSAQYAVRWVTRTEELHAAQALRFEVFNLELKEGLQESYVTRRDEDRFDEVCEHLIVEHVATRELVGTYRMQTGVGAGRNLGYYCAQEFEFDVFEPLRPEMVELGRACVHRDHRNLVVLGCLWKGIADYAVKLGARYLVGCSSLTSQDPAVGAAAYEELCRGHLAASDRRTRPLPQYACPIDRATSNAPKLPKLLRAYLGLGAKICGPPALDPEFKTIDFLTLLDIETLAPSVRQRFLG